MPSTLPGPEDMLINATRRKREVRKEGGREGKEEGKKEGRQRGNEEGKEECEMDWLEKRL